MKTFDLAFIGLGAASLSLATRLVDGGFAGSVVFIDPDPASTDAKTWCGWGPSEHPFRHQITRSWHAWTVGNANHRIRQHDPSTPYEMLRGKDVRLAAMSAITTRSDWEIRTPRSLKHGERSDDAWKLTLDDGTVVQAQTVLDARPPQIVLERPWLWQSFFGIEIEGDDFGDDDCVNLMEFTQDEAPLVSFFYELPISRNHRLIEYTRFTPEKADLDTLKAKVESRIAECGWGQARIVRSELGHLPMAPITPDAQGNWVSIGTAGGSMRPATGYAFHAIQTWADQAAQAILSGKPPAPPQRSKLLDWLDGVFLESLWREPQLAAERYEQLFAQTPSASITRFLMSRPAAIDIMRVLMALPLLPMLKAAWCHGWRRR